MIAEQKTTRVQDTYYYLLIGLIVLACACSIFAQIPDLNPSLRNLLNYFPWIVAIIYMLFYFNNININHFKLLLFPLIPFGMYLLGQFLGVQYNLSMMRSLMLSSLVYCIGVLIGENVDKKHFKFILKAICIVTLLYSIYLYFVVLGGGTIYSETVGVAGKNSVSLIVTVPIVLMLYSCDVFPKLRWLFVPFLTFLVILIGSRTSMICCLAALMGKIFIGNRSRKEKVCYTVALIIVIYLFVINESVYDRVVNQIFLKGKELNEENLNKITSGRTEAQSHFWGQFKEVWFVGGRGYSYENFYLDTLGMFGVFGGIPIYMFAFSPIYFFLKDYYRGTKDDLIIVIFALNILMLINGLGETLCPFGPGVKCFVLWLTFGYYIGFRYKLRGIK